MAECHGSLFRDIVVGGVVVAGVGADDREALFECSGRPRLEGPICRSQNSIGAPATLKQEPAIPLQREAQMEFHDIVLPIGTGALAQGADHFAMFRHRR